MKIQSKVCVILCIEAIFLILCYTASALAIAFPATLEKYLKELFTEVSDTKGLTVVTDRGESASEQEREIYILKSASFTAKVFMGILVVCSLVVTILFIILYMGVKLKGPRKLCFWLSTHSVFVVICTFFIIGSVTSEPEIFVYQIPNCVYQIYRIGTIIILYGFKKAIGRQGSTSQE